METVRIDGRTYWVRWHEPQLGDVFGNPNMFRIEGTSEANMWALRTGMKFEWTNNEGIDWEVTLGTCTQRPVKVNEKPGKYANGTAKYDPARPWVTYWAVEGTRLQCNQGAK